MTNPHAAPEPTYATYPSLVDRGVFVTGGADGIGSAIVEQFAKQGAKVVTSILPNRSIDLYFT